MNIFNLIAKLTLDDSTYISKIVSNSTLTQQQTEKIKQKLEQMQKTTEKAIRLTAQAFAEGKIGLEDYSQKMSQLQSRQRQLEESAKQLGVANKKMSLSSVISWTAIATAVVGVIRKMGQLMYSTTEYAGSIKDLAQVYETTYQNVQELNYIAQESGKNAEWVLRKARSSGQSYAEVLGLSNEEYQEMIANAKEMGIILENDVIDRADMLGDQISQLKYQWQAVLTGLLAGNEDAEEQLSAYFERVGAFIEQNLPTAVQFTAKFLLQLVTSLVKLAPQIVGDLISELVNVAIDIIFDFDWYKVGWNLGLAVSEGVINIIPKVLNKLLGKVGIKIPTLNLDSFKMDTGNLVGDNSYNYSTNNSNSSNVTNNTTITIEAKDANAREIANEVSRILSTQIQAKGR